MIDHDRLFKELLSAFFVEFLELFLPEVVEYIEPKSITFLDKEIFTDVTVGEKYETDLLAQVQFRGEPSFFLIHVENQSSSQAAFGRRMFRYFARLFEKHDCPVYPIVVFSYDQPRAPAPDEFRVDFPDFSVLSFSYRVIQLNRLNWRDFVNQQNPVASALMAKMRIEPEDRPKVKAEYLRLLTTLLLNPAKMQLISGFFDTYLKLTPEEESAFRIEINQAKPEEQEKMMQIMNNWMRQGLEQGRQEGELRVVVRLLTKRLGVLPSSVQSQLQGLSEERIDQLTDRLSSFKTVDALSNYLDTLQTPGDT